jgi:hypothetical protein
VGDLPHMPIIGQCAADFTHLFVRLAHGDHEMWITTEPPC